MECAGFIIVLLVFGMVHLLKNAAKSESKPRSKRNLDLLQDEVVNPLVDALFDNKKSDVQQRYLEHKRDQVNFDDIEDALDDRMGSEAVESSSNDVNTGEGQGEFGSSYLQSDNLVNHASMQDAEEPPQELSQSSAERVEEQLTEHSDSRLDSSGFEIQNSFEMPVAAVSSFESAAYENLQHDVDRLQQEVVRLREELSRQQCDNQILQQQNHTLRISRPHSSASGQQNHDSFNPKERF